MHTHTKELEALLPTRPDPPALDPEEEADMIGNKGSGRGTRPYTMKMKRMKEWVGHRGWAALNSD